jgi:hypothetical protein
MTAAKIDPRTFSTVLAGRPLCQAGCGRRTNGNALCSDCRRLDPIENREKAKRSNLLNLLHLADSGQPITGPSCLNCGHFLSTGCGLGIPECSVSFASLCNCYLPR